MVSTIWHVAQMCPIPKPYFFLSLYNITGSFGSQDPVVVGRLGRREMEY